LRGHHQNRSPNPQPPKLLAQRVPIELRHHHIQQNQVRLLRHNHLQPHRPVRSALRPVALRIENVAQRHTHRVLVFHNDNPRPRVGRNGAHRGNSSPNRLPCPTALSTITRPPCASATCFTMLSPIPAPSVSRRNSNPYR